MTEIHTDIHHARNAKKRKISDENNDVYQTTETAARAHQKVIVQTSIVACLPRGDPRADGAFALLQEMRWNAAAVDLNKSISRFAGESDFSF